MKKILIFIILALFLATATSCGTSKCGMDSQRKALSGRNFTVRGIR